jgi:hypothetical protein
MKIHGMDRTAIIAAIDEELARLGRAKALLSSSNSHKLLSSGGDSKPGKTRVLSAEARQRIAAAQKKRWAKHRKLTAATKK